MAKKIYETETIKLIDGTELRISPLKLIYLRDFMEAFDELKNTDDDVDSMRKLCNCVKVAMQQYHPLLKTVEDVEDNIDLETMYTILDVAGGIKLKSDSEDSVQKQANDSDSSWDNFDLVSLESEVFLLGIWKDYEELEKSMSLPEIVATLNIKRELEYNDKKFNAAIQGVDLDKQTGRQDEWQKLKDRVFNGNNGVDSNDVTALTGNKAAQAGFGIGMGLSYEKIG